MASISSLLLPFSRKTVFKEGTLATCDDSPSTDSVCVVNVSAAVLPSSVATDGGASVAGTEGR